MVLGSNNPEQKQAHFSKCHRIVSMLVQSLHSQAREVQLYSTSKLVLTFNPRGINILEVLIILLFITCRQGGVTLAQLVKLLSCDWKATGSSPGNSLLCKKQGCVQYTEWWDPFPDPAYVGALVHRVALFYYLQTGCRVSHITRTTKGIIDYPSVIN